MALSKGDIELKLERLIGREVQINHKIKHSSHHVESYAGMKGILKDFDLGEKDYEDILTIVEVVTVTGKKRENKRNQSVWVDARDIAEISNKE